MKRLISLALIALMGAVACQENEPDYIDNGSYTDGDFITFSAALSSMTTKASATYDDDGQTLVLSWKEGDNVGVYPSETPVLYKASTDGTSATLTTNIKMAEAACYSALYPYLADVVMEDGFLALNVPAEQAAADGPKYHLAVAQTSSSSFSFKNVTAMVRLNLIAENVTQVDIEGNAGEIIAGDVTVNPADASFRLNANGESKVSLIPADGSSVISPGVYYVSVIPQILSNGFKVTYHVGANVVERQTETSLALDGNTLIVCETFGMAVEGSQSNPFTVGSVTDLQALSSKLAMDVPNYVILTDDIDMSGVDTWTPICNDRTVANIPELHFDGKGHTISNFAPAVITSGTGGDQASLFGILYGSCRNLNISADIDQSSMNTTAVVCGFAGYPGRGELVTTFENVHVSGEVKANKVVGGFAASSCNSRYLNCRADVDVTSAENHVGGFVARGNGGDNHFEACVATGDLVCSALKKGRYMGGFYGGDSAYSGNRMSFVRCYATGNVTGNYQMSAFVGYLDAGTVEITDCYAGGAVALLTGNNYGKQIGGIVGVNKGKLDVTRCYFSGSLDSGIAESVGGILGLGAEGGNVTISKCFSVADLTSPTYGVGGMVGYTKSTSLTVENCFASGALTAPEKVGAIVGLAETATTVKSCRHNTDVDAIIGSGDATEENNAKLSASETADYSTLSKIAGKLGWSTEIWNLSGDSPVLK